MMSRQANELHEATKSAASIAQAFAKTSPEVDKLIGGAAVNRMAKFFENDSAFGKNLTSIIS